MPFSRIRRRLESLIGTERRVGPFVVRFDPSEAVSGLHAEIGAITRGLADADMGTELTRAAAIQGAAVVTWGGTTTVTARLTTVGANTDALTAGSITWYLICEVLP